MNNSHNQRIMQKFTKEDKEILLDAIDHYIDAGKAVGNVLVGNDKGVFIMVCNRIEVLRVKLLLDLYPIGIKHNNTIMHEELCELCECPANTEWGEWPFLGEDHRRPICLACFEKYAPELAKIPLKTPNELSL